MDILQKSVQSLLEGIITITTACGKEFHRPIVCWVKNFHSWWMAPGPGVVQEKNQRPSNLWPYNVYVDKQGCRLGMGHWTAWHQLHLSKVSWSMFLDTTQDLVIALSLKMPLETLTWNQNVETGNSFLLSFVHQGRNRNIHNSQYTAMPLCKSTESIAYGNVPWFSNYHLLYGSPHLAFNPVSVARMTSETEENRKTSEFSCSMNWQASPPLAPSHPPPPET